MGEVLDDLIGVIGLGKAIIDVFNPPPVSECKVCKCAVKDKLSINDMLGKLDSKFSSYVSRKWIITDYCFDGKLEDKYADAYDDRIQFMKQNTKLFLNEEIICSNCFNKKINELDKKFDDAYANFNFVETYPATYKKPLNLDNSVKPIIETYEFDGGKWNTINKMKFWAVWEGYDVIYNITFNYDEHKITGVFAKLKK